MTSPDELVALSDPSLLPPSLQHQPWLAGQALDGSGMMSNGVRFRLRIEPFATTSLVIFDVTQGAWEVRSAGLREGSTFLNRAREGWPEEAWIRFSRAGLIAQVPRASITALLLFMNQLLSNPNCTAVLGLDSSLEPAVPFNQHDGAALRTEVSALEPE